MLHAAMPGYKLFQCKTKPGYRIVLRRVWRTGQQARQVTGMKRWKVIV